jgi:hypothetical protein
LGPDIGGADEGGGGAGRLEPPNGFSSSSSRAFLFLRIRKKARSAIRATPATPPAATPMITPVDRPLLELELGADVGEAETEDVEVASR